MKRLIGSSIAAVALMLSAPAFATTQICPEEPDQRVLTVTITGDPLTYTGALTCSPDGSSAQPGLVSALEGAGYTEIDKVEGGNVKGANEKFEVTGVNGTEGDFKIYPTIEGKVALVFFFGGGEGQGPAADPTWLGVVFLDGIFSEVTGDWIVTTSSGQLTALSNVTLWQGPSVPEPGTMALLGAGLLGLAALRRRRKV